MVDASVALPDAGGTLVVASVLEPFVGSEPPPPSARARRLFVVDAQNQAAPFPPGAEVRGGAIMASPPADVSHVTGRGKEARLWAGFLGRGLGEVVELDLTGGSHRQLAAPPGTVAFGAPLTLSDDGGWLLTRARDAARPDDVRRVFAYDLSNDAAPVELQPPADVPWRGSRLGLRLFGFTLELVGEPAIACLGSSLDFEPRIDFCDPASGEHLGTLAGTEDGPVELALSMARLPNGRLACQVRGPREDEAHLLVLRVRR